MYVYLENGVVVDQARISPFDVFLPDYAGKFIEAPDNVTLFWRFENNEWLEPIEPVKTPVDLANDVQVILDNFAKQKDFDGINDTCSYVNSTVLDWATQAQIAIKLRDATWEAFYKGSALPVLEWI